MRTLLSPSRLRADKSPSHSARCCKKTASRSSAKRHVCCNCRTQHKMESAFHPDTFIRCKYYALQNSAVTVHAKHDSCLSAQSPYRNEPTGMQADNVLFTSACSGIAAQIQESQATCFSICAADVSKDGRLCGFLLECVLCTCSHWHRTINFPT